MNFFIATRGNHIKVILNELFFFLSFFLLSEINRQKEEVERNMKAAPIDDEFHISNIWPLLLSLGPTPNLSENL